MFPPPGGRRLSLSPFAERAYLIMKNKPYNKEDYCDFCKHLTTNKEDLICGCSLLIWWNESRLGKMGNIMGFIKPAICTKWETK